MINGQLFIETNKYINTPAKVTESIFIKLAKKYLKDTPLLLINNLRRYNTFYE